MTIWKCFSILMAILLFLQRTLLGKSGTGCLKARCLSIIQPQYWMEHVFLLISHSHLLLTTYWYFLTTYWYCNPSCQQKNKQKKFCKQSFTHIAILLDCLIRNHLSESATKVYIWTKTTMLCNSIYQDYKNNCSQHLTQRRS